MKIKNVLLTAVSGLIGFAGLSKTPANAPGDFKDISSESNITGY